MHSPLWLHAYMAHLGLTHPALLALWHGCELPELGNMIDGLRRRIEAVGFTAKYSPHWLRLYLAHQGLLLPALDAVWYAFGKIPAPQETYEVVRIMFNDDDTTEHQRQPWLQRYWYSAANVMLLLGPAHVFIWIDGPCFEYTTACPKVNIHTQCGLSDTRTIDVAPPSTHFC
jgi:hypothetical protein